MNGTDGAKAFGCGMFVTAIIIGIDVASYIIIETQKKISECNGCIGLIILVMLVFLFLIMIIIPKG